MKIGEDTLAGKTALVTGAGSGIGLASAKLLAQAGARVALLGRTADELSDALAEIGGKQAGHFIVKADVGDEQEMAEAFKTVSSQWNHLDILLVNAGINGVWAPLDRMEVAEWDETIRVNLRGTYLTTRNALPLLKARGAAVTIVSSVNGTRMFSNTGATAYACTKAAQVAFAKMIALELAKDRVRVNVICPGAIDTKIDDSTEKRGLEDVRLPVEFPEGEIPLTDGEPGTAEQVACLVWFLSSDAASHITGTEIFIEGAQSLLQG
ncbi:SDR family oxidoreductase [Luteolibacter sp. GHJ8]|uniref:SDR family oxidoreductase n=1 Tax=Luteolibacter rhizosphaerae TaxID=2989719 RepID=A0ABT3FWT1_9BACT|nr:SDR family NAD(P)-dependent oxidoreductase [Luteolibacter rhizosphaerae]MCW1912012.1 SDR family oxidoreductase [Luteolibacter rhizosphaerae]